MTNFNSFFTVTIRNDQRISRIKSTTSPFLHCRTTRQKCVQ